MGNDEPVTPVFPNSDYCTGLCGSTAVLEALTRRAEHGGSYGVDTLFSPAFFEERRAENLGVAFVQVKPIAQFTDGAVDLGYHIGTRGNGVDQPVWPADLTVEVVSDQD
ncbi:putative caib baif family enzyme protein [Eutypa lata UCREL1]|uniref:Putative caib baif family enzyme protein n=1 Tax=Eutypa lata (strain UCR-EL1) TaxID=1287681 RepID=M7TRG7_EUTLA|nr:putative caib baif family enzyme protein [Eutypa lata UCREL1]